MQIVIHGEGERQFEDALSGWCASHRDKIAVRIGYDEALAHRVLAASDVLLAPSRFEPCGLTQMYAMKYGAVPVARRTGGLADSVIHFDPATGTGTGIVFNDFDRIGGGPRLHKHPYPETFIIRSGVALFTVGGETVRAGAGQIVIVPADTPHKFTNAEPTPLESIDIHESGEFVTEWLE